MSKVLIVGDLMLDEFIYGSVSRISPEAATPVLSASHTERMVGGAGNVARGVAALDCECDLISVMGSDAASHVLISEIQKLDKVTPWISVDMARATTHKMRFVSEQHSSHLLRVDAECLVPVSGNIEHVIMSRALDRIEQDKDLRVVVLSDYCKGLLTDHIIREIIVAANVHDRLVIVDSKRRDLEPFRGAHYLKLNLAELGVSGDDATEISIRAARIIRKHGIGAVIVTRGEDGLMVFGRNANVGDISVPGKRVRVRDVSGAGDTVVAAFAASMALGLNVTESLIRANKAASIAVSKPGTAVVTLAELQATNVVPHDNLALLDQRLIEWRGKRIGFANGCFDLLHPGHVHMLEVARSHCDKLIVGLNSDASVRHLKGETRPIQNSDARAAVLAALDSVDLVVGFNAETPAALIAHIKPDVLVKGSDYEIGNVVGREHSGAVVIVDRIDEHSTTEIAERVNPVCPIGWPTAQCAYPDCGCAEIADRSLPMPATACPREHTLCDYPDCGCPVAIGYGGKAQCDCRVRRATGGHWVDKTGERVDGCSPKAERFVDTGCECKSHCGVPGCDGPSARRGALIAAAKKPSGGGFSQSGTAQERDDHERIARENLPWVRGTED